MGNQFVPGCCGCGGSPPCPGPISIGVGYTTCDGRKDLQGTGLSVVVSGPEGYTATPTVSYQTYGRPPWQTFGAGASVSDITIPGLYTFTITGDKTLPNTTAIEVANLCQPAGKNVELTPNVYPVTVTGCIGQPVAGASVSISGLNNSGSATTGADGVAHVPITVEYPPAPAGGPMMVTVEAERWQPATRADGGRCGYPWGLPTWNVPEACYICCATCNVPHSDTMTVTTPVGTVDVKFGEYGSIVKMVEGYGCRPFDDSGDRALPNLKDGIGQVPVEFLVSWSCGGGIGIHYPIYNCSPYTGSQNDRTSRAKDYALAMPSSCGRAEYVGGSCASYTGNVAGNEGVWEAIKISCSPGLEASGPTHPIYAESRYGQGEWRLQEAGCGGGAGEGVAMTAPVPGASGNETAAMADFPGPLAMAATFAGASLAHLANGMRKATPEIQESRRATCDACPHNEPGSNRCRLCGCGLSLKRSWASSTCPDGRWLAESETTQPDHSA